MAPEPEFVDPLAPKKRPRVTGERVPPAGRKRIWQLHMDGHTYVAIARMTGFDRRQVSAICKDLKNSSGDQWAAAREVEGQPDPRQTGELSPEARRALTDFSYFRGRYFGRLATPWQEEAAYRVLEMLETPEKEFAVINVCPASGKDLALDTPLLTPAGWSTMKEIEPGDEVFDERGRPVRVVAKSEVLYGQRCYEVATDDGASVVAGAGHEWVVRLGNLHSRPDRPGKTGPKPQWGDGRTTHTTEDLARPREKRPKLQLAPALRFRRRRLPIEPWLLGYWLGNGASAAGAVTSGGLRDDHDAAYVAGRIGPAARIVRQDLARHTAYIRVKGLSAALRREGLLDNKYVPEAYLRASAAQRLALLQGLVDSDGHVDRKGEVEFCSTSQRLAEAVQFLVRSLGAKASLTEGRAVLDGRDCGPKWRVHFFLAGAAGLPRKADRTRDGVRTPERYLTVTPVESVPTQCLQVDSPSGLFLAGEGLLVTHNSTLFTHDIPAWLACRNRRLRALIGSRTYRQARWYTARLRRSFERYETLPPDEEEVIAGRALKPQASLVGDFGRFRPLTRFGTDLWRAEEFVIAQVGDLTIGEKEASFAAYGFDSGYLGGRFRFVVWDDLVDRRNTRNAEQLDQLIEQYEDVAVTRLEMGGLLLLQGQRIAANDLYRHALDQHVNEADDDEDDDEGRPVPKYHRLTYKAHYDEECRGKETHGRNAPYWRPPPTLPGEVLRGLFGFTPPPNGCLLDPRRITWRELRQIKANRRQKFAVLYQQEDVDPEDVLVPRLWIDGGTDPQTGELFPGCWDKGRGVAQPPAGLVAPFHSYVAVDPSPTQWWGIQWWGWHPPSGQLFLLDLVRRKMDAPEFLDWNHATGAFSGLAEEWQLRSEDLGCRITHWIVEANAAQRFLLQYEHVRRWMTLRRVTITPHQTQRNRSDPEYGIQSLAPLFRHGQVRLPTGGNRHGDVSRLAAVALVDEVTRYPDCSTDDAIMAMWMGVWNQPRLFRTRAAELHPQKRPSWIGHQRVSPLRSVS